MKKVIIGLALVSLLLLGGCASLDNSLKHMTSSIDGLDRVVTLYNQNGGVIKTWDIKAKVEAASSNAYFLTKEGKAVYINGTYIIEEK